MTGLVRKTAGAIGFPDPEILVERSVGWLPPGVKPVLMGDRFSGSPDRLAWCARHGWSWRLRLKAHLLVAGSSDGETPLAECFHTRQWLLTDVFLTEKHVRSHVAMIHDPGHDEPWIIALSERPTSWRALD